MDFPEEDDAALSAEIEAALLKELGEFGRQGVVRDTRARLGKPSLDAPPEEAPLEGMPPPEDEEIPGVEAVPQGEGEEGGGPDVEKLKAILAKLKGG